MTRKKVITDFVGEYILIKGSIKKNKEKKRDQNIQIRKQMRQINKGEVKREGNKVRKRDLSVRGRERKTKKKQREKKSEYGGEMHSEREVGGGIKRGKGRQRIE